MSLINADKPQLWKADVERSIDFYNDWFIRFAPATFRAQRSQTAEQVITALRVTDYLRDLTPERLKNHPEILPVLRMATAPPVARDRLVGLAHVSKSLVKTMEGDEQRAGRMPPRMPKQKLADELGRICDLLKELADGDLFTWLEAGSEPGQAAIDRASVVVADRLCGAASDPIIRNAQERRQLTSLKKWLAKRKYRFVPVDDVTDFKDIEPGTFTFRLNIPVGASGGASYNIPVDCAIQPTWAMKGELPLLIEAKSAGDFTNTNKRRKEEAQKVRQLRERYGGNVQFILLLCGYFGPDYLGYEASEGIDWVWEHRMNDLSEPLRDPRPGPGTQIVEPAAQYVPTGIEAERLKLQTGIDSSRTALERNQKGQFATPFSLALEVVQNVLPFVKRENPIRMLEPSCGTGAFFSALRSMSSAHPHIKCTGVELDLRFADAAQKLWSASGIVVEHMDFIEFAARDTNKQRFDLICANPPYVRHHHLGSGQKQALKNRVSTELQLNASGLSGLYIYFILLSHSLLAEDAIATWLIPSEFLVVNYGRVLRDYLTTKVQLIEIFQFDPEASQFGDALVSSCIVTYRNTRPRPEDKVLLRFGTNMRNTEHERHATIADLASSSRWHVSDPEMQPTSGGTSITIGDLFKVRRGIATGANAFFVIPESRLNELGLPPVLFRPVLTSPRQIEGKVIEDRGQGIPLLNDPLFLLDTSLPEKDLKRHYPAAWNYLEQGRKTGVGDGYLCRSRDLWYQQEKRDPAPFMLSYMGRSSAKRNSPFRFFLNHSKAIATNGFLCLYPKPFLSRLLKEDPARKEELLNLLNSISAQTLKQNGRSYGGGLQKVEPKELRGMPLPLHPEWLFLEEQLALL